MAVYFFTPLNDFLRSFCPPRVKNTVFIMISKRYSFITNSLSHFFINFVLSMQKHTAYIVPIFQNARTQKTSFLEKELRSSICFAFLEKWANHNKAWHNCKVRGGKRTGGSLQICLRIVWFSISCQRCIRIFLRIGIGTEG